MDDATRLAHPRCGDDDGRAFEVVERLLHFDVGDVAQRAKPERIGPFPESPRLGVEVLRVQLEDLGDVRVIGLST